MTMRVVRCGLIWLLVMVSMGICRGQQRRDADFYQRVHDSIAYKLETGQKLFFYFNSGLNCRDSFSVVAAEYNGTDAEYAVIVHNKHSKGHVSFEPETIEKWKMDRTDEWVKKQIAECDTLKVNRQIEPEMLQKLRGFWVHLQKYKGKYYLNNDWDCLVAYELTDSTWLRINMEVIPELLTGTEGNMENFTISTTAQNWKFQLMEPKREIYKVISGFGASYLIPVRKIHEFEIIEYINTTGDLIMPFLKFEK